MNKKEKQTLARIAVALVIFITVLLLPLDQWFTSPHALYAEFVLFLIPYLIAGYDVLLKAAKNIGKGHVFDENFLMSIATIGAFLLVFFPDSDPHMAEGAAVMLFYQVGEFFQDYAVGKSRKSIAEMMDIAPDYANIMQDGKLVQVDPYEVAIGDEIIIKPGERIPLDGVIVSGSSQLDTAALTGESIPRTVEAGSEVISGCINLTGMLTVKTTKLFEESTVSRILELVETASEKKARTENFITRFARYYTPIVVCVAALLAFVPPLLFGQSWSDWVERGLIFLVVSCPCALVISVPLSFFGGIGGASRLGILVKGSNYLEALAKADTVVFDKTGTLTTGTFEVVSIEPSSHCATTEEELLELAAHAEACSNHPIALSVRKAFTGLVDNTRISKAEEQSGHGVKTLVDGDEILVGNARLMEVHGIAYEPTTAIGSVLHLARNGKYLGHIVVADVMKPDAKQAISDLHANGVQKTIMLTGDKTEVAAFVAKQLGIDEFFAELLPQDKVSKTEALLERATTGKLVFVGDGINDAPVLTRADIGIAMGAMGSDAAIEAADIVLMDDKPSNIARAIKVARKTMGIVWQNIVFALGVKFAVLFLAAFGVANLWLAVFADVGVAVIAIINAMRAMKVKNL